MRSASPPPIKLAHRFFHIIDFHADPITCISASTGTVSYDSLVSGSPRIPAQRAFRQLPHPHGVVRMMKSEKVKVHLPVEVDLEMFRKVQREEKRREKEVSKEMCQVRDWHAANKEVNGRMTECLANFHNQKDQKAIVEIMLELPASSKEKKDKFIVTQRTVSEDLWSSEEVKEDPRKMIEKVFKAVELN